MNEVCDRPTTAERLLTREQITLLDDAVWLEEELDRVVAAAKQIEVDLEFRSDDFATDEWEHRARKALAAHHVCQGHLTRRIKSLRDLGKVKGPTQIEVQEAKARKKEAEAARIVAAADHKRLKASQEREKTMRAMISFADRQSLLASFQRVARDHLDANTFGIWMQEARALLEISATRDIEQMCGPAQVGTHPKGGDSLEAPAPLSDAVAKPCAQPHPHKDQDK